MSLRKTCRNAWLRCMPKIIAGKHRGRNIETLPGKEIRPTTGFAREAIFNILMHGRFSGENSPLIGKRVTDLFCGTGALGFEALSRGAAHVCFVDQNLKALDLARKTALSFNEMSNVTFIRSDSTHVPKAQHRCSLAFIDPPYEKGMAEKGLNSLIEGGWLEKGAVIVVEQAKKEPLALPPGVALLDERIYGITRISILNAE